MNDNGYGNPQVSAVNFFEYQNKARRGTLRLSILFIFGVALTVVAVNLLVMVSLAFIYNMPLEDIPTLLIKGYFTKALIWATLSVLLVVGVMSLYRIVSLRGGGGEIARQLGGVQVPEDVQEFTLRRYRNVVEEIAIASGVPMPELYVLENEPGINAFAAGNKPENTVIGVTRGALNQLNREELQAVIAHEFSHIANGDMRINLRFVGIIFGIMGLGIIAGWIMRISLRRGKDGIPTLIFGLVLLIIGYVGVLFGKIIKAGISRQREYLADASAVQFTRQSRGLSGALMKISGVPAGAKLRDHKDKAQEFGHMLFGKGVSSIFATHPPMLKRIQRLNPNISKEDLENMKEHWAQQPPNGYLEDVALGFAAEAPSYPPRQPAQQSGQGQPYPQPNQGQLYPQPSQGQPYPQPNQGRPYPQPGQGQSYPQPSQGQPYPQPNQGQLYPQANRFSNLQTRSVNKKQENPILTTNH
ncbi:MAG: M48 family metalloprotease [Peptococcaceae bacterium]|nr:M48 family metalloprotease [Peptococcaceae bacterium]